MTKTLLLMVMFAPCLDKISPLGVFLFLKKTIYYEDCFCFLPLEFMPRWILLELVTQILDLTCNGCNETNLVKKYFEAWMFTGLCFWSGFTCVIN